MDSNSNQQQGSNHPLTLETSGQIIRWPRFYDALLWVVTRGQEQAFRQLTADIVGFQPGESVLDVGCGTGTLALLAKERVGETGLVFGIEPSARMTDYARRKAARRRLAIDFQPGVIEKLAFPDQTFDVVLCVVVFHHMPDEAKRQGLDEIARVLKPGGRLLVVDSNLHLLPSFEKAGFTQMDSGEIPFFSDYCFALWKIGSAAISDAVGQEVGA